MPGQKKPSRSKDEDTQTGTRPSIVYEVLSEHGFSKSEIDNASQVLDFVQYLLDDDENLTKSFNLNKAARDQLMERISEVFEGTGLGEEDFHD